MTSFIDISPVFFGDLSSNFFSDFLSFRRASLIRFCISLDNRFLLPVVLSGRIGDAVAGTAGLIFAYDEVLCCDIDKIFRFNSANPVDGETDKNCTTSWGKPDKIVVIFLASIMSGSTLLINSIIL